ncbi:unnamed protein product [marine sediment metagenome]|uniref:Uncharacterized protein n=1 Tax=marine sediment metagenome TaxID=412755 RepID=X1D4F2_9ZZZZ
MYPDGILFIRKDNIRKNIITKIKDIFSLTFFDNFSITLDLS